MATELTPCGALFETMKRYGGISHKDLARLLLSGRPLADGKSPLSRCDDRTWVSRFIVHAPVGSLQDRYFCDWGVAALRVSARLRSRDGKGLSAEEALSLVTNQGGALMEQALRECHQDLALYRNVLERLARGAGYSVQGLGSSNGTVLISGEDGSETVVEPARAGASACAEPVEVHAGDELVLAGSTRFMLIEGMPESWE